MALLYPRLITWRRDFGDATSPDDFFSAKTLSRIRKVSEELHAAGYVIRSHEVDDEFLDAFVPVYAQLIGDKEHGHVFDVRESLSRRRAQGIDYRAISLWKDDVLVGGLVYSVRERSLSCAFRVFPHELPIKLPVNLSMVIEYTFFSTAILFGKRAIIHGKDRNAYGLHANIGLAQYKIRLGCVPYVSKADDNELLPLPSTCEGTDALFFLKNEGKRRISRAVLVSNSSRDELFTRYPSLLAHDAAVGVRIVRHDQLLALAAERAWPSESSLA